MLLHATVEELLALFSVWSVLRLYLEDHWEKLTSQKLEAGGGGY
jgi:hypothetical protein